MFEEWEAKHTISELRAAEANIKVCCKKKAAQLSEQLLVSYDNLCIDFMFKNRGTIKHPVGFHTLGGSPLLR